MDPPNLPGRGPPGSQRHGSSTGGSSYDSGSQPRAEQSASGHHTRQEHGAHSHRASAARQITRTRTSYSCQACRRRKVKCDKAHPICGECSKNGEQCVYGSGASGSASTPAPQQSQATSSTSESGGSTPAGPYQSRVMSAEEAQRNIKRQRTYSGSLTSAGDLTVNTSMATTPVTVTEAKDIESRLDRLTSMVEQLVRAQPTPPANVESMPQQASYSRGRLPSPQEQRKRATEGLAHPEPKQIGSLRGFPIERTFSAPPRMEEEEDSGSEDTSARRASSGSDMNIGHLALEGSGRSSYIGNTYWASIYDEVAELNQLLRDQSRYHNPSDTRRPTVQTRPQEPGTAAARGTSASSLRFQGEDIRSSGNPLEADTKKVNLLQPQDQSTTSRFYRILPEVLANLPSKRQCDVLYRAYMQGVHPIMPMVHPPDCLEDYNDFWNWFDKHDHGSVAYAKPSFIPLLYAILYGGSVSCPVKILEAEFRESRSRLSHRLHDEVTRSLAMVSFPRTPSIYSLCAFLIVQSILMREEEPMVCSTFVTLALRVAQSMGLHRDGARFGLSSFQTEVRRRVWWHIVFLDTMIATTLGLPPLVNLDYADCADISELKDKWVGTDIGKAYEREIALGQREPPVADDVLAGEHDSMVCPSGLYTQAKVYNTTVLKRIDRTLLGVRPILVKDVQKIQEIYNNCRDHMLAIVERVPWEGKPETDLSLDIDARVQSFLETHPLSISGPVDGTEWDKLTEAQPLDNITEQEILYQRESYLAFPAWVRIVTSLLIDKTFCVSYQPFLKTSKSQMWKVYRERAIKHCHAYMDKFILLTTVKCFQPFQWSWPGNHQPMHAAMILLVDLYKEPMSAEAVKSRSYIDKLFALSGPDGGVVRSEDGVLSQRPLREGGKEAWDMLRRLRQKAWEKAGLDPDVLWTDLDENRIGFAHPLTSGERMMKDLRQSQLPLHPPAEQGGHHYESEYPPSGDPGRQGPATQAAGASTTSQAAGQGPTLMPQVSVPLRTASAVAPSDVETPYPSASSAQGSAAPWGTATTASGEPGEFNWDEWDNVFGDYLRVGDLMDVDQQDPWPFKDDNDTDT